MSVRQEVDGAGDGLIVDLEPAAGHELECAESRLRRVCLLGVRKATVVELEIENLEQWWPTEDLGSHMSQFGVARWRVGKVQGGQVTHRGIRRIRQPFESCSVHQRTFQSSLPSVAKGRLRYCSS